MLCLCNNIKQFVIFYGRIVPYASVHKTAQCTHTHAVNIIIFSHELSELKYEQHLHENRLLCVGIVHRVGTALVVYRVFIFVYKYLHKMQFRKN